MPEQPLAPVDFLPSDLRPDGQLREPPTKGIGLCLSGGGYRAMLFHLGALWRLQEVRYLDASASAPRAPDLGSLARISSVSGGSITSAMLALRWPEVATSHPDVQTRLAAFKTDVVNPIRAMSEVSLAGLDFKGAIKFIGAVLLPGSVNDYITRNYAEHLFGKATLQDLPDSPRFVINASNLQSGALWRFSKPYMWDWRVGKIDRPTFPLARAVAASSAFPPVLAPAVLTFKGSDFVPGTGGNGENNLQRPPYTTRVELADGGVYDNLGLETVWKKFQTVLVSNGAKPFGAEERISIDWVSLGARVIGLIDNQVGSLRRRLLLDSYRRKERWGSYWGIENDISHYQCSNRLPCPFAKTQKLAAVATDLSKKDKDTQERLINWGYAICDAALRSWVDPGLPAPTDFPYSQGVG
jgi:NTE family protein